MGIQIRELLYRIRKERKIEGRQLYMGICTASNYSNYEKNKRIPDFLTLNGILERLGEGVMSLSAYLSKEELVYLKWRNDISDIIRNSNFNKLKAMTNDNIVVCSSLNKRMQEQFLLYVKGVEAETVLQNQQKALEYYEVAVRHTCPWLIDNELLSGRIGRFEIGIYSLYVRLAVKIFPEKRKLLVRKK